MKAEQLGLGLSAQEIAKVRELLGREPNETEWSIIDAEWSEHSSYKSSRGLLKLFPTTGKRVVLGPGYDAGVVDVGDGLVVTLHIESHNHPSAVDPYGGAATGIGGVLRDILSVASRPIALVDILRFGLIEKSGHSRWLFKNVVRGIADYGNCISGEDSIYVKDGDIFRICKAGNLFAELVSDGKLANEFSEGALMISRPKHELRMLSFDFDKLEAQFRRITRLYRSNVRGLLRLRTALGRTICVTPDHPMFVVHGSGVNTIEARDLRIGDAVPIACDFPYPRADSSRAETIDLIDELRKRNQAAGVTVTSMTRRFKDFKEQIDPHLRRIGCSASDRSHYFRMNYLPLDKYLAIESLGVFPIPRSELLLYPRRGNVTKVPAVLAIDPDFSRLVGYFLSEGCESEEKAKENLGWTRRLIWTFGKDETEYIDDICSILSRKAIRFSRRSTETNSVQIKVSSQILGWLFREVLATGTDAYTKRIPDLFYRLPLDLNKEVLRGILRGDASLRGSPEASSVDVRFATASPVLFEQVMLLMHTLGYVPSCSSSFHQKSTVPLNELAVWGRARVEKLKEYFSQEIVVRADRRIELYAQPAREYYRSVAFQNFASVKIIGIEKIEGEFDVFNFEVEGTHNYVTSGGIITHNCIGVPTVAGEIEFDESFERNCLVDVACVGVGKKSELILGEAKAPGDVLVLIGGSTGRDGIKGATFASKNLKEDAASERSSVQVPDPFMKKLLLDSLLEIISGGGKIRGMKDLGGGGLSTALSEVASKGGTGVDVELKRVRLREDDMTPTEAMISESQERMLLVLPPGEGGKDVISVLDKYGVPHSVIGKVTSSPDLVLRWDGKVVADLPASLVTDAPLIDWPYREPKRARGPVSTTHGPRKQQQPGIREAVLALLSAPNIASKRWVYQQYDHEVGVRTMVKPGQADAAVLRLPNGRFLAIKGDGNSRQAALEPYWGAAGCVAEACRNVVATGAEPIAMVDHLQSGDPSDPEVYWAFRENLRGMADYCKSFGLPVVGGKVSFYNEDSATGRAIKPSPIALVVGLISKEANLRTMAFERSGDAVVVVGETRPELAGSEFATKFPGKEEALTPRVDAKQDLKTCAAILRLIDQGLVDAVHDCAGGGIAVAVAEMSISGGAGARVDLSLAPGSCRTPLETAFSESHGRFIVSGRDGGAISELLARENVPHGVVGRVGGRGLTLESNGSLLTSISTSTMRSEWERAIPRLMD